MSHPKALSSDKRQLRGVMKARRAEAHAKNPDAATKLRDLFLDSIELPAGTVIAGYVAHDFEIDPYPLMEALHRRGCKLCLPVVNGGNEPLTFRSYTPGDILISTGSPPIPEPTATAATVEPDVVLVPLLAFDIHGNRLGWGAGHYDCTLISLRNQRKILTIGLAFDSQKVTQVPVGPRDAALDKIITETHAHIIES